VLYNGKTEIRLPERDLVELERFQGRRSNIRHRAAIGGIVGSASGVLLGLAGECLYFGFIDVGCESSTLTSTAGSVAVWGGLGLLIGGIAGTLSHTERWERFKLPMPVRLSIGQPELWPDPAQ
jgi:hypothetical protein